VKQNPGHPGWHRFRGRKPHGHTLACLRFAGLVAETVARLATGSGGLTLGRAGFAPAGRRTKFHGVIAASIPLRPAVPGRTVLPMPHLGAGSARGAAGSLRRPPHAPLDVTCRDDLDDPPGDLYLWTTR
jgi:hypothetical protein